MKLQWVFKKILFRIRGMYSLTFYMIRPFQSLFIVGWPKSLKWMYWLSWIWITFGLILLTSSSIYSSNLNFVRKQLFWILLSLIGFGTLLQAPLHWIRNLVNLGFFFNLVGIIMIIPYGITINGATRWLCIGPLLLQPAELIKPFFIWQISFLISYWTNLTKSTKFFWILLILIIFSGILFQPNLSTAGMFAGIVWVIVLMSQSSNIGLFLITLIGVVCAALSIFWNKYQQIRILTFLQPWSQSQSAGYQLIQSLLAVGSGGIFGQGLGNSNQKLGYLPIESTDFIFAIFSEECGFIGNLFILLACFAWLNIGWNFVRNLPSKFLQLIAYGSLISIIQQIFFHVSVSTGLLPTTGLPFPFWSYGGNAIIANILALGLFFRTVEIRSLQK